MKTLLVVDLGFTVFGVSKKHLEFKKNKFMERLEKFVADNDGSIHKIEEENE